MVIEDGMGQRLVRMELKYCERCGGLLLRRSGEAVVYCGPCDMKLRELPSAVETRRLNAAKPEERLRRDTRPSPDKSDTEAEFDLPLAARIQPQREILEATQQMEHRRQA
jgi:uncharacterized Zn finger protein (UPF0148 family)